MPSTAKTHQLESEESLAEWRRKMEEKKAMPKIRALYRGGKRLRKLAIDKAKAS